MLSTGAKWRAPPFIFPSTSHSPRVELIRFRRHVPKGRYDVHDGRKRQPAAPRREFSWEFRAQAVGLVLDEGKTVGAVARELDFTASALRPRFLFVPCLTVTSSSWPGTNRQLLCVSFRHVMSCSILFQNTDDGFRLRDSH